MLLSDLFEQLTIGELSQLSLSGIDEIGISECNYIKVVPHIQLGLTELHKRFPVRMQEVIVQQYDSITDYELNSKFAVTNKESEAPIKYIEDSIFEPFVNNVLRIESIHDEDGQELFLNDSGEYWSVHTSSYNTIHVPLPEKENVMSVMYRADHDKIPIIELDPYTTEINVPLSLLEALLFYVAARVYTNLNSDGAISDGNNYMQKFEASCVRAEEANTINRDNTANKKLDKMGWV